MADDRERNQGMKQDTGKGQEAPGRNPQDDRSAGQHQDVQPKRGQFDPSRGGDGGSYKGGGGSSKEGGQKEQTRR